MFGYLDPNACGCADHQTAANQALDQTLTTKTLTRPNCIWMPNCRLNLQAVENVFTQHGGSTALYFPTNLQVVENCIQIKF